MSRVIKKWLFAYAKTKTQVFATWIVQSLYFLNPKFQASSQLLWLHSLVCVGPGRKPRRPVFSQRGSLTHFRSVCERLFVRQFPERCHQRPSVQYFDSLCKCKHFCRKHKLRLCVCCCYCLFFVCLLLFFSFFYSYMNQSSIRYY